MEIFGDLYLIFDFACGKLSQLGRPGGYGHCGFEAVPRSMSTAQNVV